MKAHKLTRFGEYVAELEIAGITKKMIAEALDIERPYVSMLSRAKATPHLILCGRIRDWSGGEVPIESWIPHVHVTRRGKKVRDAEKAARAAKKPKRKKAKAARA